MGRRAMVLMILAAAAPALGQEEFRHGRIRYLEPSVLLQRAYEAGAEEAVPNLPFLPGDRVWTDSAGRAEFQFADGSFLRLDSRSKLDYLEHRDRRDESNVLQLWSGGIYLHTRRSRDLADFEIETPGGLVETTDRGVYRIDVDSGETRLSVYEGEATLDSGGRRVRVEPGERTYARRGEEPEDPARFDAYESDDFARWDEERDERVARAAASRRYLPEDIDAYAGELDDYGSWYYEAEIGHVWRPYAGAGWRPYYDGRWVWTVYGWTWVPYEPWGWVTFHYGRWGWSPALGWYWIPGTAWGPAWVSWGYGGDYVGWCPLGYGNRPVIVYESPRPKGYAVPRNPATPTTAEAGAASGAWVFVPRSDLGLRDVASRAVSPREVRSLRVLEPRLRLDRELRVTEAAPTPRNVKLAPTIGDSVPELRSDPATTIRPPLPRRRSREDEPDERPRVRDGVREEAQRHPTDVRSPRSLPVAPQTERVAPPAEVYRPTDSRSQRAVPRQTEPSARPREARPRDSDDDVLRRFFAPLSQSRSREGERDSRPVREETGSSSRSRSEAPRNEPRRITTPSHEPQRSAPPAQRPVAPTVKERPKKKDN